MAETTEDGYYKASTHERTSDLNMIAKGEELWQKKQVNKNVESELNEFRQEIDRKF